MDIILQIGGQFFHNAYCLLNLQWHVTLAILVNIMFDKAISLKLAIVCVYIVMACYFGLTVLIMQSFVLV